MKQPFQKRFIAFLKSHDLVHSGGRILVAVSGGRDSMTLLHSFCLAKEEFDLRLSVAHVHHGLRGEEADQDERFVREFVRTLGIPFYGLRVDVPDHARKTGRSVEDSARDLRYRALESIRRRIGFELIALGHHADDQAETILLNLFRGSGIRGLGGMHPKRNHLIRPFLFASRKEIDAFSAETEIPSRFDSSNLDRRFLRNRLRLDVMPILKDAFGESVIQTVSRGADAAREIDACLREETEKAWPQVVAGETPTEIALEIEPFLRYFKSIQKSMAALAVEKLTGFSSFFSASDYDQVLRLAEAGVSGAQVLFHNQVRVIRAGSKLVFMNRVSALKSCPVEVNQTIRIPESQVAIRATEMDAVHMPDLKRHDHHTEYVDHERLEGPLTIRSYREGDFFIPLGMAGHKKIHDFFVDEKIPNYRRREIPVLVCGEKVVWIAGYRIDDRFKVTSQTMRVLKLELIDDPNREG